MDKVYFTKEEFNKLWNKLEYLGKGGEGTRKKLNKSETIKYLDGPYNDLTETQINQFIDLKNQTYLFPYKIVCIDNEIMGYITRYSSGKNLIEVPRDTIRFDKFIIGSKNVEDDTKNLSDEGVLTHDILFNILYKNGIFHMIDTYYYEIVDEDNESLYKKI